MLSAGNVATPTMRPSFRHRAELEAPGGDRVGSELVAPASIRLFEQLPSPL